MSAYVIDASAAERVTSAIDPQDAVLAPEIIDLEVANLLRKSVMRSHITSTEATHRFTDWVANDVQRVSHRDYLRTVWAVRHNITPYDAAYVALAMHLDLPLITADKRLAKSAAAYCEVVTID